MKKLIRNLIIVLVSTLMLAGGVVVGRQGGDPHTETDFKVKVAEWDEWRQELFVAGHSGHQCEIIIYNAGNMAEIGTAYCPDKRWSTTIEDPEPVPCRVHAVQLDSEYCDYDDAELDVQYAPDDCGP
jgi:hypothetical protein